MIGAGRKPPDSDSWVLGRTPVVIAAGLCGAIVMLVWLSYVSTREWQQQTMLVLEQRKTEALALASTALTRDMRGVWTTVIAPLNVFEIEEEAPYDLMQTAARAFARFPYPESFVMWNNGSLGGSTFVFNRTERLPSWDKTSDPDEPYPVVLVRDPEPLGAAIDLARHSKPSLRFVSINVEIDDTPYQIVAHRMFSTAPPHDLNAMVGFTVNLQWVEREYFGPLLRQVAQIGGTQDTLSLSVEDGDGRVIAASSAAPTTGSDLKRDFALLFLDAAVAAPDQPATVDEWSLHVRPTADNPMLVAQQGTRRMFFLMALAATISTTGLLMTVRAVRASAVLASMKSDFVAAVTHELKTPVAAIRLVGDTLAQRRYESIDTVADYARLLSQEAARLSRSIDGLLTYSKYTALRNVAVSVSVCEVADIVEEALEGLRPLLDGQKFDLRVDVPKTLPPVAADRQALVQVFECIIDNAIKYSSDERRLDIVGRADSDSGHVRITFADRGIGIPAEDIPRVFDRFHRGQNAGSAGSGLGLTIARRIILAHNGTIAIRSTLNAGTDVELSLVANAA